ncbi:hypothetical protein EDB85DRAFT_2144118 [Lactarius pseudohatsudake]|nr:hypothetical protein EDB85DRAFT_2144118 [Lactarius pseudohatsudake]
MPPNPNPRPGENPADIVTGARKRKASERSVLASDLPPTGPKRPKVTTATGAKRPVAIKVTAAKSSSSLENAFSGRARVASRNGPPSTTTTSRSSTVGSLRHSIETEEDDSTSHNDRSSDGSDSDDVEVVGSKTRAKATAANDLNDTPVPKETDEAERDRLAKDWSAPTYAFFHPVPSIDYAGNPARRVHVFECNAKQCKGQGSNRRLVRRYLDTADGKSTSNLRRHAKLCWGEEAIAADALKSHGASSRGR